MADIHGMNDFGQGNGENNNAGQGNGGGNPGGQDNMLFFGNNNYNEDPRKESLCSFLKNIFCPQATWKSLSVYIIIINFLIYFITLGFGLALSEQDLKNLLPVKNETLMLFSLFPIKMRENWWGIYRWISNSFLHAHFVHIFYNSIGILIFGTFLEKLIGLVKYLAVYVISGILGSLFTGLISPNQSSVGASICLYGIIGGYFSFCFIKWKSLDRILGPLGKCLTFYFLIIYIIVSFLFQMDQPQINLYGHLGGLIMGFFFLFIIYSPDSPEESLWFNYNIWRYLSLGLIGCFAIAGFLCFYLIKKW